MITCGRGMWNHRHTQGWFMGTVNNISTHLPSLFRKGLREMERRNYSNFYASSKKENGEIYEGFGNVLSGPFRHSLHKEMTFFILSGHKDVGFQGNLPQSSEGGLVQVGLLSVGVETQLGPPGPPVPTPVKVFWLQNISWNSGEKTQVTVGLELTYMWGHFSDGRTTPEEISHSPREHHEL